MNICQQMCDVGGMCLRDEGFVPLTLSNLESQELRALAPVSGAHPPSVSWSLWTMMYVFQGEILLWREVHWSHKNGVILIDLPPSLANLGQSSLFSGLSLLAGPVQGWA